MVTGRATPNNAPFFFGNIERRLSAVQGFRYMYESVLENHASPFECTNDSAYVHTNIHYIRQESVGTPHERSGTYSGIFMHLHIHEKHKTYPAHQHKYLLLLTRSPTAVVQPGLLIPCRSIELPDSRASMYEQTTRHSATAGGGHRRQTTPSSSSTRCTSWKRSSRRRTSPPARAGSHRRGATCIISWSTRG